MATAPKKTAKANAAEGMAVLNAPKGATSCSWGGNEYEVVEGLVEVPAEAVHDLQAHGYTTGDAS